MPYPNSDWPTSKDSVADRVDDVDVAWASDFNYLQNLHKKVQDWIGTSGELIGDGVSAAGPGGMVSPAASGGEAFKLAARNDFTAGKLLTVGDDYDSSYVEKCRIDYDGKIWTGAGIDLSSGVLNPPSGGTLPSSGMVEGDLFYKTGASDGLYSYDGAAWNIVGGSGTDDDAVHDNVAGEINAVTEKSSPVGTDLLLIEDSADSNNKKKVQITNLPSSDADAIHDNVAAEISAVSAKATPTTSDYLLIEDAADSNNKKSITIGDLPAASDDDAIHDNVDGEINAVSAKGTPHNNDVILVEDSEASYAKKKITIGTLPSGGSSTDVQTHTVVVGNSPAGDTSDDCDYLDTGNGVQLQSALTDAGAESKDVFIRRGTYDLGGSGASGNRLSVPGGLLGGVRVIGASKDNTIIQTRVSGDGRAFSMGQNTTLESLHIECPEPTGAQSGTGGVVSAIVDGVTIKDISVNFTGGWPTVAWGNVTIDDVIDVDGAGISELHISDCKFTNVPKSYVAATKYFYGIQIDHADWIKMDNIWCDGGDRGMRISSGSVFSCHLSRLHIVGFYDYGIGAGKWRSSSLNVGFIETDGANTSAKGFYFGDIDDSVISDVFFGVASGSAGIAISSVGSSSDRNVFRGCRGDGNWTTFIELLSGNNYNTVIGNSFNGDAASDAGTGNDFAHNQA